MGIAQENMSSKPIVKSVRTRARARKGVTVQETIVVKPKRQRSRRRGPRAAPQVVSVQDTPITPSEMGEAPARTNMVPVTTTRIQRMLNGPAMSEDGEQFVRYHLDPAGYHETIGKKGRMIFIPDGALDKGVGGEVRTMDVVSAPNLTPASVPLDGSQWSVTLISLGTFRLNFIVLASLTNQDATTSVVAALAASVNDFTYGPNENVFDYMALHDAEGAVIEGWYWKPVFLKQTSSLPEPVNGISTTVDKWRIVGSGITAMFNAPTLVNQGCVAAGQFAREVVSLTNEESLENFRGIVTVVNALQGTNATMTIGGPALQAVLENPPLAVWTVPTIGGTSVLYTAGQVIKYQGADFAVVGDVLRLERVMVGANLEVRIVNDTDVLMAPIAIQMGPPALLVTGAVTAFYLQTTNFTGEMNTNRRVVPLPPITTSDIVSNDPDCEVSILKRSTGVYGVHVKTGSPVYNFASATEFGPINLGTPGYEQPIGGTAGGIRDTLDPNVGTIVMTFQGLSTAANMVVKRYFTWEGMPSEKSTVGQFAAAGGECDQTAMAFVDNFSGGNNCVYAARDNFLGAIAGVLKGLLGSVVSHQATPSVISGLAGIAKDTIGGMLLGRR